MEASGDVRSNNYRSALYNHLDSGKFSRGITAFPENENEQDLDRLTNALEKMRQKTNGKKVNKEMQNQLDAAEN